MYPIRLFSIISWNLLPTVTFGGYFLLHLQVRHNVLTPFKETLCLFSASERCPVQYGRCPDDRNASHIVSRNLAIAVV